MATSVPLVMLKVKSKSTSKLSRRLVWGKSLRVLTCLYRLKLLSNSEDMLKLFVSPTKRSSLIHNTKRLFRSLQTLVNKSWRRSLKTGRGSSIKVAKTPSYRSTTLKHLAGKASLLITKEIPKWLQSRGPPPCLTRGGINSPNAGILNPLNTAGQFRINGNLKVNRNCLNRYLTTIINFSFTT